MANTPGSLPDFVNWPSFPFEGSFRLKKLQDPVAVEPDRQGEGGVDCPACSAPDSAYIWVSDRWRVQAMERPSGLPMVLVLETRSHFDLGDLPNLLAAELGVMTVRLEKAIRSLDGVARVHVNRWGDGSAHLQLWFLARPYGQLQLRGSFLSLWDEILPAVPVAGWREDLALVAAWLAEYDGTALAEPPHIEWKAPASFAEVRAAAEREASGPLAEAAGAHVDAAIADAATVTTGTVADRAGDRAVAGNVPVDGGTVPEIPADGPGSPTRGRTASTPEVARAPSPRAP